MCRSIRISVLCGLMILITSCATTPDPTQKAPGFLPNYSLLKLVYHKDGTQIYAYKNPIAKRNDYHAAILEPVILYQSATESGVSQAQIEHARAGIDAGITPIIGRKIQLTNTPGPGVLRIQIAITGAILHGDGFRFHDLVPISAAIKLASMATGLDNKQPILIVELKMLDSQNGTLLKEVASTISGDKFRQLSHTSTAFEKLATTWIHQALKFSTDNNL